MGYYLLRDKWQRIENASSPIDTLIVGDSSGNQGVIPAIIEQRLGGSSVNLCTTAGSLVVTDAWMLGRYLEKHSPPKRVVVVHAYDAWLRTRDNQLVNVLSQTPIKGKFWEGLEPSIELTWSESAQLMLAKWFPLYRQNLTLQMFVFNPVGSFEPPPLSELGFMEVKSANKNRTLRDQIKFTETCTNSSFRSSPINRDAVEVLIKLAQEHQFQLYFVSSPVYEDALNDSNVVRYCDAANHWISEKIAGSNTSHLLFSDPFPFPLNQLESFDHVNVEGAKVFTEAISTRIREIEANADEANAD